MEYFQLSVKEKTRMFMFTASELKRKKNKKGNNHNSDCSDYNDTQNGCNGYKSIIQDFYDFVSHWLSIKWQMYRLTRSLRKEQRKEKQLQVTFDTQLKTVPQIELIFISLFYNNFPYIAHHYVSICKTITQEASQLDSHLSLVHN